jgi:hypothetical protein
MAGTAARSSASETRPIIRIIWRVRDSHFCAIRRFAGTTARRIGNLTFRPFTRTRPLDFVGAIHCSVSRIFIPRLMNLMTVSSPLRGYGIFPTVVASLFAENPLPLDHNRERLISRNSAYADLD